MVTRLFPKLLNKIFCVVT